MRRPKKYNPPPAYLHDLTVVTAAVMYVTCEGCVGWGHTHPNREKDDPDEEVECRVCGGSGRMPKVLAVNQTATEAHEMMTPTTPTREQLRDELREIEES